MLSYYVKLLIIYGLVPLFGLIVYVRLWKTIDNGKRTNPPLGDLFIVFFNYGGLLLVLLTVFFLHWTKIASWGTLYLVIPAPIMMGALAYHNYTKRKNSRYYLRTFIACAVYFVIAPAIFLLVLSFNPHF